MRTATTSGACRDSTRASTKARSGRWKRQFNKHLALQPSFQYINNDNGDFLVLATRLCCSF